MADIVIKVENLGKSYLVGHNIVQNESYTALRDVFTRNARTFARKARDMVSGRNIVQGDEVEEFWALKEINFEIRQGDRVGIIGRNGAGKSTLLKVISRITEPTTGRISINGRVASLLEVGTGFHQELTGRENIFLNGAILGMTKAEIQRKFDAIVDFSGVEKFLDTPVKRYSSGMYMRLAFAVAAHLESDILIVDEVLAVGDSAFQKKCMGKIESIADEGRTVLFVSHNMGAVSELCNRAVLLDHGKKLLEGASSDVIEAYMRKSVGGTFKFSGNPRYPIFVTELKLLDSSGNTTSSISMGEDATLEIQYKVTEPLTEVTMAMLLTRLGSPLLYSYDTDLEDPCLGKRVPGTYVARVQVPMSRFKEGQYSIEAKIGVGRNNLTDEGAVMAFEICNYAIDATHKSYRFERPGHLYWPLLWDTQRK